MERVTGRAGELGCSDQTRFGFDLDRLPCCDLCQPVHHRPNSVEVPFLTDWFGEHAERVLLCLRQLWPCRDDGYRRIPDSRGWILFSVPPDTHVTKISNGGSDQPTAEWLVQ